ncbi:hypothetical protein SDC9_204925 [bioreactor metagenome]|uniref:Uncharacterized protein n=1 Tax=bioreactor metagenome TaxID=1076179 RepID=A0A645J0W5_9ZZZZ
MPAEPVHPVVKRAGDAALRLAGQRGDNVRGLVQPHRVINAQRADGGHHLRTIDERQTLLGGERHRRNARAAHCLRSGENFTVQLRQTFANHRQNHMRQRHKISTCAKTAFFGDNRMQPAIQHAKQCLHR